MIEVLVLHMPLKERRQVGFCFFAVLFLPSSFSLSFLCFFLSLFLPLSFTPSISPFLSLSPTSIGSEKLANISMLCNDFTFRQSVIA